MRSPCAAHARTRFFLGGPGSEKIPFARICKDLRGFAKTRKALQGFAYISRDLYGSVKTRKDLKEFAYISKDLQGDPTKS